MSDLVCVSIICSARVRASSARFCQYLGSSVMFETITSLHSSPPSVLIKNARAAALIQGELRCKNNSLQSTRKVVTRCPLLAQSGHRAAESQCPLLQVKRTSARHY